MDIPVLLAGLLVLLSKIVSNATFRGRHLAQCIFRLTLSEAIFIYLQVADGFISSTAGVIVLGKIYNDFRRTMESIARVCVK